MTTSTPRLGSDAERICRSDLQRVEMELEAMATSQQVEAREVSRIKEAIKSIHDDLGLIKEQLAKNNKDKSSGRRCKKIPPVSHITIIKSMVLNEYVIIFDRQK